jgi:hypothetical protein
MGSFIHALRQDSQVGLVYSLLVLLQLLWCSAFSWHRIHDSYMVG